MVEKICHLQTIVSIISTLVIKYVAFDIDKNDLAQEMSTTT